MRASFLHSQEAEGHVQHTMGLPWRQVALADMGQKRGTRSYGLPTRSHSGPQVPAACLHSELETTVGSRPEPQSGQAGTTPHVPVGPSRDRG